MYGQLLVHVCSCSASYRNRPAAGGPPVNSSSPAPGCRDGRLCEGWHRIGEWFPFDEMAERAGRSLGDGNGLAFYAVRSL